VTSPRAHLRGLDGARQRREVAVADRVHRCTADSDSSSGRRPLRPCNAVAVASGRRYGVRTAPGGALNDHGSVAPRVFLLPIAATRDRILRSLEHALRLVTPVTTVIPELLQPSGFG